jgi:phosphopantothenoylcysteine decarboxylase
MKVLIGCTGSVATIKLSELVDQLKNSNFEVQVVATECAKHFLSRQIINCKVWVDDDEWNLWKERGDPVLHIDLRKWADILVVAPLDANSLAKIAQVSYSASNYYAFKSN